MTVPIVLTLLALIAALILILAGLAWFIFQRPIARTRGELRLEGLQAPVEIIRDGWGVPHIYAQSEADAWFAQGVAHAQDRLFQMDYNRRLARGALAEVFGPAALEADRWSRVLGFWRSAGQDLQALDEAERAALEAYAAGVDAFVDANQTRLPAEFTLLSYRPRPWTPQDSLGLLKLLGWALSQNWEAELLRVRLLNALGPERAAELDPPYPAGNPLILPGSDSTDSTDLARLAGRLQASFAAARPWFGRPGPLGSNNWVIGPAFTAGRHPLLANDPHLTLSMPTLWYENHVETAAGDLQFSGATMPGLPAILIGHNRHIAWGLTAGRADTQDLFIEQPHPDHPTWFRYEGQWEAATVHRESIAVHGQEQPHIEEVVVTRHGPLISGLLDEEAGWPALALGWTGHQPAETMRGLFKLPRAVDWPGFRDALGHIGEQSLNAVYADTAGNIGYQFVARVPRRRSGFGLTPVPGWEASHAWEGLVPFDDLPSAFNPERGFLLSANNKPATDDAMPFLGHAWYPGYRAARIERLLQTKPRYTVRDFQRMQTDVYAIQAEALVPYLITIDSDNPFDRRILHELESWNLRVEVDSFPAAAYEVMRLHLLDLVLRDKLGDLSDPYLGQTLNDFSSSAFAGSAGVFLVDLLAQEESWWYGDGQSGQARSRDELLRLALQRTAATLQEMIGKEPRKWAWGKVHQVNFAHVLGRGRLLRPIFNRGQYPIAGDEHTVWVTATELKLPFGLVTTSATYRTVLDPGDWDRSTAILSTGQSGQPGSPHYANHIDMWREGEQHPLPWTRPAVEAAAAATLWLRPAGS